MSFLPQRKISHAGKINGTQQFIIKLKLCPLVIESLKTVYIQLPSSLHRPFVFIEDKWFFRINLHSWSVSGEGAWKKRLLVYIYSILSMQTVSNDLSDAPLNFTLLRLRLFFFNFQEKKCKKYCVMQFSISVIPGPAFTYPNMYS